MQVQHNGTEQGFNTTDNSALDAKNSNVHNTTLLLSSLQAVNADGTDAAGPGPGTYYAFKLDIHQSSSYLTLDDLQLWQSDTANFGTGTFTTATSNGAPTFSFNSGATQIYDLNSSGNETGGHPNSVLLNSDFLAGSGGGSDLAVLIPTSDFNAVNGQYVYLYSAFGYQGGGWATNATFEEWGAVLKTNSTPTPTAVLSGEKFVDANGDGILDPAHDVPKSGVDIFLYQDTGTVAGHLDAGDTLVGQATTDASGAYSFGPLNAGNYIIVEGNQAGWVESPDAATTVVNTVDPTKSEHGYAITLTSDNVTGLDFANFQTFSISGTKYTDHDGLDNQTAIGLDDTVLGGVTINLYDSKTPGTVIATTTTAADGTYTFSGLGPLTDGGSYLVKEAVPAGDTETFGSAGYTVAATSGNTTSGDNFANFVNFSISGTKYTDHDGLDNQTAIGLDDTVLGGVTINLYDSKTPGTVIATTTTAADGTYTFSGLGPLTDGGSYLVKEAVPAGDTETFGSAGYTVAATSGNTTSGDNFANFVNFSISGTKYTDHDGLDNQTAIGLDDTVLGGVTINLYDSTDSGHRNRNHDDGG